MSCLLKLASDLWPEDPDEVEDDDDDEKLSLEEQIAREVSAMKRPKRESRFGMLEFSKPSARSDRT